MNRTELRKLSLSNGRTLRCLGIESDLAFPAWYLRGVKVDNGYISVHGLAEIERHLQYLGEDEHLGEDERAAQSRFELVAPGIAHLMERNAIGRNSALIAHCQQHPNDKDAHARLVERIADPSGSFALVWHNNVESIHYTVDIDCTGGELQMCGIRTICVVARIRATHPPSVLQYFEFEHLPEGPLRKCSKEFNFWATLLFHPCIRSAVLIGAEIHPEDHLRNARKMLLDYMYSLPHHPEAQVAIDKIIAAFRRGDDIFPYQRARLLLEAKDCAVRSLLPKKAPQRGEK